jgi:hypothetical protein
MNFFLFSSSFPLTWELAPIMEHRADYSVSLIFSQAVGFLGRVISSSQGLYLNTGEHKHRKTRTHIKIHAQGGIRNRNHGLRAIESDRRLFMPQTARLPRPALLWVRWWNWGFLNEENIWANTSFSRSQQCLRNWLKISGYRPMCYALILLDRFCFYHQLQIFLIT